jgi:hypothetical protein
VLSEELLLLDRNVHNDKIKSGLDAVSPFFYTQQQAIVSKMCSNENGQFCICVDRYLFVKRTVTIEHVVKKSVGFLISEELTLPCQHFSSCQNSKTPSEKAVQRVTNHTPKIIHSLRFGSVLCRSIIHVRILSERGDVVFGSTNYATKSTTKSCNLVQ